MTDKESIKSIVEGCGVKLYDIETVSENEQKIFRIYITSEGGVSLDKCAEVTRVLSPIFDVEPPVSGAYTLEVSSPGIERPLKKDEHFSGSIGEMVKIKLINTDTIIGKLQSFEDGKITLIEDDGEVTTILQEDIDKARTYYKW